MMYVNMSASLVITAAFMTYDIKKKYCHAIGRVTATQDQLSFTCQQMRAYFVGDKQLKLKCIRADKGVSMRYVTSKNKIVITGLRSHFENQKVVFTGNPRVVIISDD